VNLNVVSGLVIFRTQHRSVDLIPTRTQTNETQDTRVSDLEQLVSERKSCNMTDDWKVDTSKPVLVTGATGYVAGVLVQELLSLGVTVHAAVRDPSKTARIQHLIDLADKLPGTIKFFKGDLLDEGSYEEGMKGCGVVFHTASPFTLTVADPQNDLVIPAVNGTRNVLNSATKTPSVTRVVVTSSCAAIYTDAADTYKAPNDILTEAVWNFNASLSYQPYSFSKIMAELAAWEIAGSQNQWTLTTINPALVMGPGVMCHESSESFDILKQLGGGDMKSGAPNVSMGIVDVREVAHAHIVAAYKSSVKGRHILCGHCSGFSEMAASLRKFYPEYPIPTTAVPKMLLWLIAPYLGLGITRRFVWNNIDVPLKLDNSKSKNELGIQYRPLDITLKEMFQQMLDAGAIKKK
jgi:nucleoside-diphosphate-sugar epimerase